MTLRHWRRWRRLQRIVRPIVVPAWLQALFRLSNQFIFNSFDIGAWDTRLMKSARLAIDALGHRYVGNANAFRDVFRSGDALAGRTSGGGCWRSRREGASIPNSHANGANPQQSNQAISQNDLPQSLGEDKALVKRPNIYYTTCGARMKTP